MLTTESKVNNLIAETLEVDQSRLGDDLTPDDVELWDSLTHLTLVTAIETTFGIKLLMREVMEMTSLSKIRKIVAGHVQQP